MNPESLRKARSAIHGARRLVSFSGAGLSAESGLATFRDNETDALWSRFDPMELASVEGFESDPERVSAWYQWRRRRYAGVAPNPAHHALAGLSGIMHVTQNVDNLLEKAGAPDDEILHLHGTITRDHCHARCGHEVAIDLQDPPPLRHCPDCGGWMRPSVVWFGETLPGRAWESAVEACRASDCLLVVGTSASVYPAASLIDIVAMQGGTLVIVNPQSTVTGHANVVELLGPAGEILPQLLGPAD